MEECPCQGRIKEERKFTMKRITVWILLTAMVLSLCACQSNPADPTTGPVITPTQPNATVPATDPVTVPTMPSATVSAEAAAAALQALYADAAAATPADYSLMGALSVDGVQFPVVWTTDASEELVKLVTNADGSVTVEVNPAAQEMPYTLTGTVTDAQGNTHTVVLERTLPAVVASGMAGIVDAAYALAEGQAMTEPETLTGLIAGLHTPWNEQYQNISVVITVEGREDKPIVCYRLKGEGAKELAVGDTVTVTGILKNYSGTIEFDAGCTLDAVVKGGNVTPTAPEDPHEIVDAAYQLKELETLPYESKLTGVITSVDTPFDDNYGNITVTIVVEGRESKPIVCYRLKGTGAKELAVGDTITVSGMMKNYYGKIEFDAGCQLLQVVKGDGPVVEVPTDAAQIVKDAFALEPGKALPYKVTLTGRVMALNTPYSAQYKNVTVSIAVEGQRIVCFRLKGEGADQIYVNDIITVSGILKNYEGIIEFDTGCTLVEVIDREDPVAPADPTEVVDSIYNLITVDGAGLSYPAELTGKIISVDSAWSDFYQNITVTMAIPGRESKPIQCYRLAGEGAANLAVGDKITVFGWITVKAGTPQFKQGSELIAVEKAKTPAQIIEEAYALEEGTSMEEEQTLTGVITKVNTPYNAQFGNVTVTIAVKGFEDKPIQCYRLQGEGVDQLAVGYTVTVTGTLSNYKGTVQFQAGCNLDAYQKSRTSAEIVEDAYALKDGQALDGIQTLTGVITRVKTPYNSQYKNVTVVIVVEGCEDKPIDCFRLGGQGADKITVGDIITVSGKLKNYKGTIEFDAGCELLGVVAGGEEVPEAPEDPKQIVEAAYALTEGASLPYAATLTGVITSVDNPYDSSYKNITVTILVEGCEDKPIICYRLKGIGAEKLAVGDTVTVTGVLKNYYGKIEFDSGCTINAAPEDIVDAAYALEKGKFLAGDQTLTGKIVSVDHPYDSGYKNITVTIVIEGREDKPIQCFRMKGEGAETLKVGDTITVTGSLTNYNGKIQFNTGATFVLA